MGVTGDRLRTMAQQIDGQQLDRDATAAQLRAIAGDVDRVEDGQTNQDRAAAAASDPAPNQGTQDRGDRDQGDDPNKATGPRGSW